MLPISAVVWWASVAVSAPIFNAEELSRLKAGEPIVRISEDETGEADGHIEAAIDIPAKPANVFSIMLDCQRAMKFVDGLKSCRVLEKNSDGLSDVREHRSRWLSILPETVSVFHSTYVPNREIRFERVRGDLKFLKGTWTFDAMNGGLGTRLTYDARIGISMPVPGFMIRNALEQDVPKLLKALRTEVGRSP